MTELERKAVETDHNLFLSTLREIVHDKRFSATSVNLTYSQVKHLWLATDAQKELAAKRVLKLS